MDRRNRLTIGYGFHFNSVFSIIFYDYNNMWIGHYHINTKSLFIPMDYRQEAIKYLNSVGLKVKE